MKNKIYNKRKDHHAWHRVKSVADMPKKTVNNLLIMDAMGWISHGWWDHNNKKCYIFAIRNCDGATLGYKVDGYEVSVGGGRCVAWCYVPLVPNAWNTRH